MTAPNPSPASQFVPFAGDLLGRPVVLVARPRGVAHVFAGGLSPAGWVRPGARPVCGRARKRLYRAGSAAAAGRLCGACETWLARRGVSAGPASPLPHTAESVVWSIFAARSEDELHACRRTLLLRVPTRDQFRLVDLPAAAARRWDKPALTPLGALTAERSLLAQRETRLRMERLSEAPAI